MTGTPGARPPDEQPVQIDWRRPASPYELGPVPRRPAHADVAAAPSVRFEIGHVLRRSHDIVRRRWLELLVVAALGWALPLLILLVARGNYRFWTHELTPTGTDAAVWISRDLTYSLAQWTIMATALRGRDQPAFSVILSVLRVLPVLVPVWLLTEVDAAWRLLASLTGYFDTLPLHQRADAIMTVLDLELSLHFVATVTVGVLYPVVLNEGRGPLAAARRAWRLMQGARWRFAGLFLLYVAAVSLVSLPDAGTAARASHNLADVIGWSPEPCQSPSARCGPSLSSPATSSCARLRMGRPTIRRLRCLLERTPSRRPLVRARRSGGSSGAVGGELLQGGHIGEVENEGAAAARRPVRAGEVGCRVAVDRR